MTGSTSGIGHAIAKGLAATGAQRGGQWPHAGQGRCRRGGARQGGAGRQGPRHCRRCLDRGRLQGPVAALPDVDILINNAGIFEPKDFFDIPDEDWSRFFEINVMSGVRLSRAYLPGMLKRNWGRIVFISSESALNIPTEMIHFGMTKTAQLAVARGLAEMTRGTAVTVNSVLPGRRCRKASKPL